MRARRNRPRSTLAEAQVGIVYMVDGEVWIDRTPVSQAGIYAHFRVHERDHQGFWQELTQRQIVPDDPYEEHPRGRVVYNQRVDQYTLYLDQCILRQTDVVVQILADMHLPMSKATIKKDEHYRCFRCLACRDAGHQSLRNPE